MSKIITLGSPSLTGMDCNEEVEEVFGKAKFPLKLTVANLAPRDLSFPELGLFLKNVLSKNSETSQTVAVPSLDALQRFVSDVEQIGNLNAYKEIVTLEEAGASSPTHADKPVAGKKPLPVKGAETKAAGE